MPPRSETFQFDRSGRLKVADNDVAELDFAYDDLGRLDTATQTYVGGPAYTAQFDYVVAPGDVRRIITYPSGRAVTETYDGRLRLQTIDGGPGVGADYSYDLADRRTGAALGNGVSSVFGFDLADRLTSIQHARDVTALFDVDYGYDAIGNRLFTRNLTPGLEERSELYEYDQRHRLRRMDRGEISGDPEPVLVNPIADNDLAAVQEWPIDLQSPGLDRRGNWSEFAETIGVTPVTTTQTRTRNGVNEYQAIDPDGPGPQSPVALAHDANGNVTLDPTARNLGDGEGGVPDPSGQVYEYDEENRLAAVRRASDNALLLSIAYDAVGRRVTSADYLAAGDPCGGPPALTRHIYAALETLEEHLSCNGGASKTVIEETNPATGLPTARLDASALGNPFAWTGQRYDAGVRLYHFLARTYSCRLGRWLERDPLRYRDDLNLYAYTASSPLRFIDPLGLELCFGPLTPKTKEKIMEQIKKQCPQATLDGNCIKLEEPKPDKCPASQPSDEPPPPPSNPKACEILRKLITSKTKYTIKTGQDKKYSPDDKVITHCVNCPIPYKTKDGKTRPSHPWEGLWHEMIHAYHDDAGTNTHDGQEEVNTINETIELLDWYNQNNDGEEDRAPRDPYSHGKSQHLDPNKGKGRKP